MEAGRGTTGYRLIDRARRMVRESSPSVLAANLFAKMNTADAESMAQRRRSCRERGVSECVGMAGNACISPKHSITCGIHRGAAGTPCALQDDQLQADTWHGAPVPATVAPHGYT
jgi:hypothetical protein